MKSREKITFARNLRKNETDVENLLWSKLRNKRLDGVKFRRQEPIGCYIVDFVSFERQLVIELDGGQHNTAPGKDKDKKRTRWLHDEGYKILRFWNNDVNKNLEEVLEVIHSELTNKTPHPVPSPTRGEG